MSHMLPPLPQNTSTRSLSPTSLTRLGELHLLLNNRKESVGATYKKNAEANDRAYDMNQKIIQATLAEEN